MVIARFELWRGPDPEAFRVSFRRTNSEMTSVLQNKSIFLDSKILEPAGGPRSSKTTFSTTGVTETPSTRSATNL